ncbi:hypothetical protein J1N35_034662 [Gossypium stocksii]|uniref:CCHC-type domain-containing protein n=1 Tax=Gossypium stocksii TaxID=47602 RepID=A0A9D3USH7_9ROSI|nr:hypothetical protein J1N35_034662 [Gossypium stocksii]
MMGRESPTPTVIVTLKKCGLKSLPPMKISLWQWIPNINSPFHGKINSWGERMDTGDYDKALSQGPWTVYGQYLTVQPWSKHFNPLQPYPSMVLSWIRLSKLPEHLGRFAKLAVYINLDRPLISRVYVDGVTQRVEYEALPTICFGCGKYGHVKEMCTSVGSNQNATSLAITTENSRGEPMVGVGSLPAGSSNEERTVSNGKVKGPEFGPWMLVEKRSSRRGMHESKMGNLVNHRKITMGSKFSALLEERDLGVDSVLSVGESLRKNLSDKLAEKSRDRILRDFTKTVNSGVEPNQSLAKDLGRSKGPVLNETSGTNRKMASG